MAFFNLTKLGVQDPIRSVLKNNLKEESLQSEKHLESRDSQVDRVEVSKISQTDEHRTATSTLNQASSYAKYMEKLTKHQRATHGK